MTELLWSEDYCYFLNFLEIIYYPVTNMIASSSEGRRFWPIRDTTIAELGNNGARHISGLSMPQLKHLFLHFRLPSEIRYHRRHTFSGEEAFLYYMLWNRCGGSKLVIIQHAFGGDPRRFACSIRLITDYLNKTFYRKISGDLLRMWLPYIEEFWYAIWECLQQGAIVEVEWRDRYHTSEIPFATFRIFEFIDDTGFRCSVPRITARQMMGYHDDIQRTFYSGYFSGHGLKVQSVIL